MLFENPEISAISETPQKQFHAFGTGKWLYYSLFFSFYFPREDALWKPSNDCHIRQDEQCHHAETVVRIGPGKLLENLFPLRHVPIDRDELVGGAHADQNVHELMAVAEHVKNTSHETLRKVDDVHGRADGVENAVTLVVVQRDVAELRGGEKQARGVGKSVEEPQRSEGQRDHLGAVDWLAVHRPADDERSSDGQNDRDGQEQGGLVKESKLRVHWSTVEIKCQPAREGVEADSGVVEEEADLSGSYRHAVERMGHDAQGEDAWDPDSEADQRVQQLFAQRTAVAENHQRIMQDEERQAQDMRPYVERFIVQAEDTLAAFPSGQADTTVRAADERFVENRRDFGDEEQAMICRRVPVHLICGLEGLGSFVTVCVVTFHTLHRWSVSSDVVVRPVGTLRHCCAGFKLRWVAQRSGKSLRELSYRGVVWRTKSTNDKFRKTSRVH